MHTKNGRTTDSMGKVSNHVKSHRRHSVVIWNDEQCVKSQQPAMFNVITILLSIESMVQNPTTLNECEKMCALFYFFVSVLYSKHSSSIVNIKRTYNEYNKWNHILCVLFQWPDKLYFQFKFTFFPSFSSFSLLFLHSFG